MSVPGGNRVADELTSAVPYPGQDHAVVGIVYVADQAVAGGQAYLCVCGGDRQLLARRGDADQLPVEGAKLPVTAAYPIAELPVALRGVAPCPEDIHLVLVKQVGHFLGGVDGSIGNFPLLLSLFFQPADAYLVFAEPESGLYPVGRRSHGGGEPGPQRLHLRHFQRVGDIVSGNFSPDGGAVGIFIQRATKLVHGLDELPAALLGLAHEADVSGHPQRQLGSGGFHAVFILHNSGVMLVLQCGDHLCPPGIIHGGLADHHGIPPRHQRCKRGGSRLVGLRQA